MVVAWVPWAIAWPGWYHEGRRGTQLAGKDPALLSPGSLAALPLPPLLSELPLHDPFRNRVLCPKGGGHKA